MFSGIGSSRPACMSLGSRLGTSACVTVSAATRDSGSAAPGALCESGSPHCWQNSACSRDSAPQCGHDDIGTSNGVAINPPKEYPAAPATGPYLTRPPSYAPQHFLYFLPLPQGQGSFRPTLSPRTTCCTASCAPAPAMRACSSSRRLRRWNAASMSSMEVTARERGAPDPLPPPPASSGAPGPPCVPPSNGPPLLYPVPRSSARSITCIR